MYLIASLLTILYIHRLLNSLEKVCEIDPLTPEKWKPFERYDRANWRMWEIYGLGALLVPIRLVTTILILVIVMVLLRIGC